MTDDRVANASDDSLYEHAACGLMVTDAHGVIQRVNATFCGWIGHEAAALVGRQRVQDLLMMGSKIFHQTHWLPLLQMQGSVAEVQLDLRHRDGHVLPALVNALRVSNPSGTRHDLAFFLAADRRKYERELLASRKRAEELLDSERVAQNALAEALRRQESTARERATVAEELVGIVSHDLRTPLNVIVLGVGALIATQPSDSQSRTLRRMATAAERATRMIGDLLDLTQARLGNGLRVNRAHTDILMLVGEAVEELKQAYPGRMIEHAHEGAVGALVDGDRLTQVITNLVGNALTYGVAERPVAVRSVVSEHELVLSVHNWGAPIPEALIAHLFEPMRRGEQQVKLGSRSVGLGLYIVQQIAAAHGGRVVVDSSEGAGTTFRVYLPQRAAVSVRIRGC